MKLPSAIAARVDDRINPIVVKELRQAVRSRVVTAVLVLFLVAELLATTLFVWNSPEIASSLTGGEEITYTLYMVLVIACLVFVPLHTSMRFAAERSAENVDLMYITTLSSGALIRGKLFAAAMLTVLIYSVSMPFMVFTYLLRGVDLPTVFVLLAFGFVGVLVVTQFGLLLACLSGSRLLRLFLGLVLVSGIAIAIGGAAGLVELASDFGLPMEEPEFWAALGTALAIGLAGMGLLYVLSVALVDPPSANRTLRVRLYVTGLWLVSMVVAVVWGSYIGHEGPVIVWGIGMVQLLALCFLVAVSERTEWGPRVRRRIPRRPLLRPGAMLLYSGSAGGVAWAVLLSIATLLVVRLAIDFDTWGVTEKVFTWITLIPLYAYCYSMSAMLIREVLFRKIATPAINWLIALTLLAGACLLPLMAALMVSLGSTGRHSDFEFPTLWLANPFYVLTFGHRLGEDALILTIVWAMLVSLLSVPWFVRQASLFRPLAPGGSAPEPVVLTPSGPPPGPPPEPAPPPPPATGPDGSWT